MSLVAFSDNEDYYKCITVILTDIPVKTDVTRFYLNKSNMHSKYSSIAMGITSSEGAVYLNSFENIEVKRFELVVDEHLCMAAISIETDLQYILEKLNHVVLHAKCIIFLTYKHSNMIQHLTDVTRQIWVSGLQRNILFIASSDDQNTNKVVTYSSAPYSTGICKTNQLAVVRNLFNQSI